MKYTILELSEMSNIPLSELVGKNVDLCWLVPSHRLGSEDREWELTCRALICEKDTEGAFPEWCGVAPDNATRFWLEEPSYRYGWASYQETDGDARIIPEFHQGEED